MNGKSDEQFIDSILHQLEESALRQKHETDALLECLLDCVRELCKLRKPTLEKDKVPEAAVTMTGAEKKARQAIASHLKGVTDAQREDFRRGMLDPADVWLGVSGGHFVSQD